MKEWTTDGVTTVDNDAKLPAATLGTMAGQDDQGCPLVRWADAPATVARVVSSVGQPDWRTLEGETVVLVFEEGAPQRPIIVGLVQEGSGRPLHEPSPKSLRVASEEELVIECGKAKISLRSDGRIEIRGGHLVSRSSGPNKIKGGTVHIN